MHPMRIPVLAFAALILVGGLLLWSPLSNHTGVSFIDALFTSTSAACVTGLSVVDIGTRFSFFGHCVLIVLMEVGGLGIMTFSTMLLLAVSGKAGLANQNVLISSFTSADGTYSPTSVLKEVMKFTFLIEAIGSLVYFGQTPQLALWDRIFFAVFHSVSAFCNAGFSTLPNNFINYNSNWIFCMNTCVLIFTGGIGFITLSELSRFGKRDSGIRRLSLHTRLVLFTSLILVLFGTIAFFFFDLHSTLAPLTLSDKILNSIFHSVSARTAGFNTLDLGLMAAPTAFVMIVLMYIGGSPGSCAGGIKTTTSAVLAVLGFNRFLGRERSEIMNRTIPEETVDSATRLFIISIIILAIGTLIVATIEATSRGATGTATHAFFLKVLFECTSAFATCGLSMGITASLTSESKLIIIALMFIGRLGPLGIITAMAKPKSERAWHAEENIMIG
jgi:trk system potassium uptake protein TrkH